MKTVTIYGYNCIITGVSYLDSAFWRHSVSITPGSTVTVSIPDVNYGLEIDSQGNSGYVFWVAGATADGATNNSVGYTSSSFTYTCYESTNVVYVVYGPSKVSIQNSVKNGSLVSQTYMPVSPYGPTTYGGITFNFKANSGYEIDYITVTGGLFAANITVSKTQLLTNPAIVISTIGMQQTTAGFRVDSSNNVTIYFRSLVDSNLLVTVYYKQTSKITISTVCSPSAGGTITPTNPQILPGASQTFTIAPNSGYNLSYVMKGSTNMGAASQLTDSFSVPTTITAYFVAYSATFNITASAGANGKISPAGTVAVANGGSQTFLITANAGYEVDAVTVDGAIHYGITSYTFTNVKATHTINATFKALQGFPITITSTGPGITSPVGTAAATLGTNKSIAITPNSGSRIASVTADGVLQPSYTGKTTGMVYTFFNVQAEHTLDVVYELIIHTISSSAGSHGSITPLGDTLVQDGVNQSYVITPEKGYKIAHIYVDGSEVTIPASGILFIDD